jgi:hypothetical protein
MHIPYVGWFIISLLTIVIGFYQYLTPYDVRQATINLVKAVQEQPPSSSNDLIEKIDLSIPLGKNL